MFSLVGAWAWLACVGCDGADRERPAAPPPSAEPDDAAPEPARAGEAWSEPAKETGVALAHRVGVALPVGIEPSQIAELWPGVAVAMDDDRGGRRLQFGDAVAGWYMPPDELCVVTDHIEGPGGLSVGARLETFADAPSLACEISTGDELVRLVDSCPGESSSPVMLVCELGDPFRRVFFDMPGLDVEAAGDELKGPQLEGFGNAKVAAWNLLAGETGSDAAAEPPQPREPSDIVLARAVGKRRSGRLMADVPAEMEWLAKSFGGLEVRKRRHYGFHVYRGRKKIARIMADEGEPVRSVTLLGSGLADPRGVEVGARFSEVGALEGVTCSVEGDETWASYVGCIAGGAVRSHYVFVVDVEGERLGEKLSPQQAEALLGSKRLSAIEVWRSDEDGP